MQKCKHFVNINRLYSTAIAQTRPVPSHPPHLLTISGQKLLVDPQTGGNIPSKIAEKTNTNLLHRHNHPLNILKSKISQHFAPAGFRIFDRLSPVVTVEQNFDRLLVPSDHVSRSTHDTYYINDKLLLRTHTSAHQHDLIQQSLSGGYDSFLVFADVYRRDEIDSCHYPVFHQLEGVKLFPKDSSSTQNDMNDHYLDMISTDLKTTLEQLVKSLFPVSDLEMRWVEAYFPFTHPSWELEILFHGKWMEVAGCGVIQQRILDGAGRGGDSYGWAFGIGLERVAMTLFDIPDIRLFWSDDPRFIGQFSSGDIVKFKPFSKFPAVYKDVSFWLSPSSSSSTTETDSFHNNDFFELVRNVAGDIVETVELVDEFKHPKTGKHSKCFRIMYRSIDKTLTNAEVNEIQDKVLQALTSKTNVELR